MGKFLKNAWYMAAWNQELDAGLLGRTIIGIPLVLFRDENGKAAALHDRCPHRFAPLSAGELRDGRVMCKYHGLRFAPNGECSDNPWGGKTPAACKVGAYPTYEQDQAVWVWMGDADKADPAKIPRAEFMVAPGMRCVKGYTYSHSNYELLTDNLMDLSHARFLHPGFGGDLYNPKSRVDIGEDTVTSCFFVENIDNPEFPECAWSAHGKKVDLWDDITWHQPANLILESGVTLHGAPRSEGWVIPAAHLITPETEHTTHYFWGSGVEESNPLSNEDVVAVLSQAFDEEDKPMIEATYARMAGASFWDLNPVLLPHDVGAVRVRRLLAERIAKESQGASA
ncbi:aromatic ring-hydroxylating dioxygenase subunit alpha [Pseudomonas citronellolis]|uniref:aromatic ring-hydroxylating dioxygenase subunit alpha n=1 Tax=Pseudomonas citronellolis TaxID=53408 RepID=UPI0022716A2A|nr:aromatic ring-hydroxylating dioxygenase subunit alpha [Pseudomonas citronellolis]WAB92974.1 aromatic ring-hydroxylating dioxygenase subunit alpha [Pseudomonas citronellolis]